MPASDNLSAMAGDPPESIQRYWQVILALFLCTLALFGVSIYSFIILAQPLAGEFGWSAGEVGGAVSAMWLTAPIALLSGPMLKRWNPWTIIYAGLLVQVAAFLLLPLIHQIEALYLLRVTMGVGKVAMITAVPIVVTAWFPRRFATVMAIVWAGGAAGGFLLSPLTNALLEGFGWKWAATAIGFGLLVLIGLIAVLASASSKRSLPASSTTDLGAESGQGSKAGESSADQDLSWQRRLSEIHVPTALAMLVAVIGIGMASIAILTQEQAVLHMVGISSEQSAVFLGVTAVGSLLGSASIGWLLDHMRAHWSGLLTAASLYGGLIALELIKPGDHLAWAFVASIACGYAFGAGEVLWITLTKRQFGVRAFATTYGGWYFALQIGYAAGGGLAGTVFSQFGSTAFIVSVAIMYLPAAILSVTLQSTRMFSDKA